MISTSFEKLEPANLKTCPDLNELIDSLLLFIVLIAVAY